MKCCAGGQCTLYRRRQATRLVAHLCWTHFTSSFHVISTLHQMCILQNVDYYYPITSNTQPLQHPAADAPVTQDTQKAASQGHLRIHRSVVLQQSTLCGHNRRYEHFPDGFKPPSTYWCTPLWQFQLPAFTVPVSCVHIPPTPPQHPPPMKWVNFTSYHCCYVDIISLSSSWAGSRFTFGNFPLFNCLCCVDSARLHKLTANVPSTSHLHQWRFLWPHNRIHILFCALCSTGIQHTFTANADFWRGRVSTVAGLSIVGPSKSVAQRDTRVSQPWVSLAHHSRHVLLCIAVHFAQSTPPPPPPTRPPPLLSPSPPSHVVSHVDGVQLVRQEAVTEVHALFLATRVDGDDAGVHNHHHPDDEVVLLQHDVGDQRDQVQCLVLLAVQLHHHHQQVGPREHRAAKKEASSYVGPRQQTYNNVLH